MVRPNDTTGRKGTAILRRHGWLSRMPVDFRDSILKGCIWQHYEPTAALYSAGDPPGGIFGIVSGSVGFVTAKGPPDSPMAHVGHRGLWFGEPAVLTGEPRRMSVVAVTAASVAYVPLPTLQAVLSARPEWWQHIGQLGVAIVDIVANCFADMMIRDANQRCAAILLRLCDCRFRDGDSDISREIVLKQNEFAAMANLSRDSVNAILQKLAGQGLVELRYGSIVVTGTKRLRKLANAG